VSASGPAGPAFAAPAALARPGVDAERRGRSVLLAGLIVGSIGLYALRLGTGAQIGVSHDDAVYLILAESFDVGAPLRMVNEPSAPLQTLWPPGYPLFVLAPLWRVLGPNLPAIALSSALLGGLAVALLYLFARRSLAGPALAAVLGLTAVNAGFAGLASRVMSDIAFVCFVLGSMLLVRRALDAAPPSRVWWLAAAGLALGATVLVRYQGLALVAAVGLWLWLRGERRAIPVVAGAALVPLAGFGLFLVAGGVASPGEMSATTMMGGRMASLVANLPATLRAYFEVVPAHFMPLVGPGALAWLKGVGLGWLPALALVLWVPILAGLRAGLARRDLGALFLLCYFPLVVVTTGRIAGVAVFDEPRYVAAAVPFLVLCFVEGVLLLAARLPRADAAAVAIVLVVGLANAYRNARDVRSEFPVPDLGAGAAWLQANTPPEAVVMTADAAPRYLYLRRRTVPMPAGSAADVLCAAQEQADYLLIAPPLTIGRRPNTDGALEPTVADDLLPALGRDPARFETVYAEPRANLQIMRLLAPAPASECM